MIKRPLNERFRQAVLDGRKVTTIRNTPWPVGQPIMLYSWSGAAYRSPQLDLCPVTVLNAIPISISVDGSGVVRFRSSYTVSGDCEFLHGLKLWQTEGFDSLEDMHGWFRAIIKPGQSAEKSIMVFRLEGREE